MRTEDVAVAGKRRQVRREVPGQARIRREDRRFIDLGRGIDVGRQAPAQYQVHALRQRKAARRIHGLLADDFARRIQFPLRLSDHAPVSIDIIDLDEGIRAENVVRLLAVGVRAHHQFMRAPQQGERALGVHVQAIAGGVAVVLARRDGRAAAVRLRKTVKVGDGRIQRVGLVDQAQIGQPAIVERVLERGEDGFGLRLLRAPGGRAIERAGHGETLAVRVEQRRAAPVAIARHRVLVVGAHGQQGARRQVRLQRAIREFGTALVAVDERMLVLIRRHGARAHAAAVVQGSAHVRHAAVIAP
ncbi:hypothetical protein D3C81_948470 [compost metagenome]